MGATERGLVGIDDSVGVQRVELPPSKFIRASRCGEGEYLRRGTLLVTIVSHGSPPVGDVAGGLVVLAGEQAGCRVPPAHRSVGGGKGGQQWTVDVGAKAIEGSGAAAVERQRGCESEV